MTAEPLGFPLRNLFATLVNQVAAFTGENGPDCRKRPLSGCGNIGRDRLAGVLFGGKLSLSPHSVARLVNTGWCSLVRIARPWTHQMVIASNAQLRRETEKMALIDPLGARLRRPTPVPKPADTAATRSDGDPSLTTGLAIFTIFMG
jgi:hypothetical protein